MSQAPPLTGPRPTAPPEFEGDPHAGAPKVLFIGASQSSHTRSWIGLLNDAPFNARLFALPSGLPPEDWPVRAYLTNPLATTVDSGTRKGLYPACAPAPPPAPDPGDPPETAPIAAPGEQRGFSEKVKDKLLAERIAAYQQAQQAHQQAEDAFNQARQAYRQAEQAYLQYKQSVQVNQRWLVSAVHGWKQQNYEAQPPGNLIDPAWRENFAALGHEEVWLPFNLALGCYLPFSVYGSALSPEAWLAQIIAAWQPDIIHTMGLEGAYFLYPLRQDPALAGVGKWIIQTRGGSDLALTRRDPGIAEVMRSVLGTCDAVITDNQKNFDYLAELGVAREKICPLCPLPGTGGMDLSGLDDPTPPSQRERVILWPKAYESPWSKALPVLEALRLAWQDIAPCQIHLLVAGREVRDWARALPPEIRESCTFHERIERGRVLELMASARVMLAPSLVDGIPNTLYEAMALGAFPLLSPLDTIQTLVKEPDNTLFARNLYPQELAGAIAKAMSDDALVDAAAEANRELVKQVADRARIAQQVQDYYRELAGA